MISKQLSKYNYDYFRKREKNSKSSTFKIKMVDLAKVFYCCISKRPDISARGNVEKLFEDAKSYELIFKKEEITKNPNINHRIIQYITAWCIFQNKNDFATSSQLDDEYFRYTQYYVLADIYQKLWEWKLKNFKDDGVDKWLAFIQSDYFREFIRKISKPLIRLCRDIKPSDEKASDYFRSKSAVEDYNRKSNRIKIDSFIKEEFRKYKRDLED